MASRADAIRNDLDDSNNSNSNDIESKSDYHAMSAQELERRRAHDLARQDDVLDQIHTGVQALNARAQAINAEVEVDIALLDDLGHRIDRAQDEVKRQAEAARLVNAKKKKVCKLYVVIVLEVIALIVIWA